MDINFDELISAIEQESNEKKIIEIKNIFTKKYIAPLYESLKTTNDKKTLGLQINELKKKVDEIIQVKLESINDVPINVNSNNWHMNVSTFDVGYSHIINQVIDDIVTYLSKFNFESAIGNEVVSDYYNFTSLNIDKNHPARNMHDSLFITNDLLLRTHCTSTTALKISEQKDKSDIRVFSYGNVYRKDEDDATHSHQFTQLDLVWIKKDLSLANLKYIIDGLIKHLFGKSLDTRYRLSYFPFTEPSFEVDVECWNCKKQGCNICKKSGWIEVLGAGMLNQNVIKEAGIKEIDTGLAAGIGIERIAMLKYGITDIRDFYNNDFDFLRQFNK